MPIVDIKGVGEAEFPDGMPPESIRSFLQKKYSPHLQQRENIAAPVEPSLVQGIGQKVSDFLFDSGIISDRYRAQQMGGKIATMGEFLPGVGDATAGDEFGTAAREGDKTGMAMASLGAIPVIGDAAKKGVKGAKTWYHGTNNYFDEFDASHLGSANPAKDSKLGFYFSKSEDTANAYRDVTPSINPDKFKKEFGRTIEEQKERIDGVLPKFKSMFGIGYDEFKALGFREQRALQEKMPNIEAGAKQITREKATLNPYTYEDYPYVADEWIKEEKGGRLIEANIPDSELMEYDYMGQAWDENKQHAIAKDAQEQGYKGVLFKDMQDSGWFGGQGIDDVALIFDPKNISQINKPKNE